MADCIAEPMFVKEDRIVAVLDVIAELILVIICVAAACACAAVVLRADWTVVLIPDIADAIEPCPLVIDDAISLPMVWPTPEKSTASAAVNAPSIAVVAASARAGFPVSICADASIASLGAPMKLGLFQFSIATPVAPSIPTPNASRY